VRSILSTDRILLRCYSSRPGKAKDGEPRRIKLSLWPIKQWILDHEAPSWPTEAELDGLAASTGRNRQLVRKHLSRYRIGGIDPHSRHGGRASYVIQEWFRNNLQNPYPDVTQKKALMSASGLSHQEVFNCLHRLRRKVIPPADDSHLLKELQDSTTGVRSLPLRPEDDSGRRGRRKWPRWPTTSRIATSDDGPTQIGEIMEPSRKTYQCTVCSYSVNQLKSWREHEACVHGHRATEWICMADGIQDSGSTCDFCSKPFASADHLEQHEVSKCAARPRHERTYPSKDSLMSHIRYYHLKNASLEQKAMAKAPRAWERPIALINPLALWCGFCQIDLESVDARMKHVALHFKAGKTMEDWVHRPSPKN
jgi:hypothetical protein